MEDGEAKKMNVRYTEFSAKHPKAGKENRVYSDKPKKSWHSYGVSYGEAFLKLDVDDYKKINGGYTDELEEPIKRMPRSEAVAKLLDSQGIKYNGIITEHGKQFFFRVPEGLEKKSKINWYCPLGFKAEWKFPASDDHIPVKVNGVERKFFKGSIDNEDVDELPYFLHPLQKGKNKPFNMEFPQGNRTQHLGGYLFHLVGKKGYSAEQAFEIVRLMNQYIFDNPIPDDLLDSQILNDSTFDKIQEEQKDKSLTHSDVAKELIEHFDLITVNDSLYSYENGVYKAFPDGKITNYLTKNYPKLNFNFEKEVMRHIKGLTYREFPKDDGTVNVRNGILSFDDTGEVALLPHSKEHISFRQFNAIYDPKAKSKLLNDSMVKWFNGSSEQIKLFNQVLGYLLMNHVNYQKIFFFVGIPSTGKTTLLKLVTCFCGNENISAIQLEDMNRPFGLASIVNKTANIFSDIRKTKVLASEIFKMLADGSPLKINQKYKKEFTYCFTGKLLFGMNSYPDFSNDFEGIERRLVIFEFKRVFKKGDNDYDPAILRKLTTDECMSVLLNMAINGYKDLIKNNGFVITKESENALSEFASDNDNVIQWLNQVEINEDYLLREPIKLDGYKGLYPDYQSYCINAGETAKAQKDFSRTICNRFSFKTCTKRVNKERIQFFKKK